MDNERWARIQAIFHRALELAPEEQRAYIEKECEGDDRLKADVEAMLAEDARGQSLLDRGLPEERGTDEELLRNIPADAFGPYRIRGVLGRGGMGIVCLAERGDFGGQVAIKLLLEGALAPSRRERFAREQKTLALLEHPFIAHIHDADTLADGTPWFAMEYVEGLRITDYCRQHDCSLAERLRLFRSVCEAVRHAHSKAIVHCDLKPSNILVKADGTVKLLDFGIARQLEPDGGAADLTRTGMRPMTLAYAAPEQVRGERPGTQADVYALGVILFELLTGRLPFELANLSQTEAERVIQERDAEPPSVAAMSGAADPPPAFARSIGKAEWADLDVLALAAMHKDQGRRYRSVEALLRDMDHFTNGEPLEARPDSVPYRLGKFVRRNRRALAATATACLVVAGLVVFFVWRLAKARNAALAEARRTQRIERFMLDLFDGGDKAAGPADNLRVVALLDRGVESARALAGEPAVQAELYQTLGSIYEKLGKYDQADALLHSALDRRKAISGAESADVGDSYLALGLLRLDQGQLPEAERLIREGLAMNRRRLGPGDPGVARSESALGHVLEDKGAYDEAIRTLEDAVRRQSAGAAATPELAESLSSLGTAHYYLGHLALADSIHRRALALHRQLYGEVHPRVADDLYNLGVVQHDLGQDAEAEKDYRQALAIKQSWYGREHPDTALIMAAVGQSLVYQKRYDEAAPFVEQALAIQERIFGKVHPQVAMGVNQLALLELRRGHLSEAEKGFTRMAEINRSVYGKRHLLVGVALLNLGEVYVQEQKNGQAEQNLREAVSILTETLPPGHANTAIAQVRLGHVLLLERRYDDAKTQLLSGYQTLKKAPGAQASRIQNTERDLVAVYEALKQPDEARKYETSLATEAAAAH